MNKKQQIEQAELNKKISLPGHSFFEWVEFDWRDGEFSWTAANKSFGWTYPMKNSNYILTFKTLVGAKRNFIKRVAEYLDRVKDVPIPILDELETKRLENKREVFSVKLREIELLCKEAAEITGETDMTADYIWGNCTMDELMKVLEQ